MKVVVSLRVYNVIYIYAHMPYSGIMDYENSDVFLFQNSHCIIGIHIILCSSIYQSIIDCTTCNAISEI